MKALLIDPRSTGCSGDMFLAMLSNLFCDDDTLQELINAINRSLKIKISCKKEITTKCGINGPYLKINIENDIKCHLAIEFQEHFNKVLDCIKISDSGKRRAQNILNSLFSAEAKVHGRTFDSLHLHETASADTIIDIVGVVLLLERHNLLNVPIYGLPVNVGSGLVKIAHGKVTVPPPAVLKILEEKQYPFFSDEVMGELLTPTGAILLADLTTNHLTEFPAMTISHSGLGAGSKNIENRPNILRGFIIDIEDRVDKQNISMLETHIDDVSGEILGSMVSRLMKKGALDVSYYPLIMKKNRPGFAIRIICKEYIAPKLAYFLMKEIGTLGVREQRCGRYELKRKTSPIEVSIMGQKFTCHFKERFVGERVIGAKAEHDDILKISTLTNLPLIEVEKVLLSQYESLSKKRTEGHEYCE